VKQARHTDTMLIRQKLAQAEGILNELGIDCWITFTRETEINGDPILPFLTDGELTWHSAFIVTASGARRAIVGQYDKQGVEDLGSYDRVIGYIEGIREPLRECLMEFSPGTIAINYSQGSEICDGLTHGMYLTLHAYLSDMGLQDRLVSAERIISALRQRKSDAEIERMRRAIAITDGVFERVKGFIRPGRTEKEVAAFMMELLGKEGAEPAWDPKSCPAVFTGPDTAGAHYAPTARKIERGHLLNMDFGVRVGGYCSDLQRTFYVLEEGEHAAPNEVQKGFETILRAIEKSRLAIRPGVQGVAVDAVARGVLAESGYDPFPHGLGHQVGRYAHDGTALLGPAWEKYGSKPFETIEEGMVFTLEPRLAVPGRGVATVEEMVRVTAHGADYLSTPQRDLLLV